jgi:hypothetical protein
MLLCESGQDNKSKTDSRPPPAKIDNNMKIAKQYLEPSFLICAAVLLISAAGMSATTKFLKWHLIKLPLPLKAPLDQLNRSAMSPYTVVSDDKIHDPAMLETLGTNDYIQWIMEDKSVPEDSAARFCSLFITYYTGNPDQVPHVPEECYTGNGSVLDEMKGTDFQVTVGGKPVTIPTRSLLFSGKNSDFFSDYKQPVVYFFKVNGKYAGNREMCRTYLQANLLGKYSYFSKVEWKFFNFKSGRHPYPDHDELMQASRKMLNVVVPLLEKDHWPDWDSANAKAK